MATNRSAPPGTGRGGLSPAATRRAVRTALLLVYAPLAALGALFHPVPSSLLGVLAAAFAAMTCRALHSHCPEEFPGLPHPALAGAAGASLPAALAGTTSLGPAGSAVVVAAVVLATAGFARWLTAQAGPPAGARSHRTPAADDPHLLRQVLEVLPLDVLFDEWHGTRVQPGLRSADTVSSAVGLRDLVVDEFHRRDPAGTTRWLTEGPDEPPERYVGRPEDLPG